MKTNNFDITPYVFLYDGGPSPYGDLQGALDAGRAEMRKYTSLGAYPLAYLSGDDEVYCPGCCAAHEDISEITGVMVVWEEIIGCSDCGCVLETAYNEPEETVIYYVDGDFFFEEDLDEIPAQAISCTVELRPLEKRDQGAGEFKHLFKGGLLVSSPP